MANPWQRLRPLALWLLVGAIAGLDYAFLVIPSGDEPSFRTLRFMAQGMLITALLHGIEVGMRELEIGRYLRRAPFAVLFATKTALTTAAIVSALAIGGVILFPGRLHDPAQLSGFARDTFYSLAIASAIQFTLLMRDQIGGRVLTNLVLGRYHRPLTEERIFLVLDLEGSTALAERMGGEGAHALLARLFEDVAIVTTRWGGETHNYIGDAVIVTWPLRPGPVTSDPILCCLGIRERIARQADAYLAAFGTVPRFRMALHGGPVVAGECGVDRRQIVYFGDTINTAVRLQESGRRLRCDLLVSAALLDRMTLPPWLHVRDLGEIPLRGRSQGLHVSAIDRRPRPVTAPELAATA